MTFFDVNFVSEVLTGDRVRLYKSFLVSDGPVAQLVEQRTENPCVGGSIPPRATMSGSILVQRPGHPGLLDLGALMGPSLHTEVKSGWR